MSEFNHTSEPWHTRTGQVVKYINDTDYSIVAEGVDKDDAERIVDCVNSCEGIPNPKRLRGQHDELLDIAQRCRDVLADVLQGKEPRYDRAKLLARINNTLRKINKDVGDDNR